MTTLRSVLAAAMLVSIIGGDIAVAQTVSPASDISAQEKKAGGERITRRRWKQMRKTWQRENRAKFTECRDKAREQKLRGRKRWNFVAGCMA